MALMDLKSNLSWYGKTPPSVDNLGNNDAPGFTPKRQELDPTEFKGVQGEEYTHTGVKQLGTLKFTDWFLNDHAKGFTGNMFPLGESKKDSQFVGIAGEEFTYTGLSALGNLDKNIRSSPGDFESYIPTVGELGTRFEYNDDFTVSVSKAKGFNSHYGEQENLTIPSSKDSFTIDDVTMSSRGLAKRLAQGGTGHPFPNYGENVYDWKPSAHIGWHADNKYADVVKKSSTLGLADTYTDNTPIDDMYNKLNLREDAHQVGYIKHPLILRGIQREGNIKNQRWGAADTIAGQISSTLDLPRGGVLTSVERGVVDIARLAKFMVSPPGLSFIVKQVGQQLMNPNVESPDGKVQKIFHKNSTKVYTPVNTLLQPLAGIAGMHIKRHGLLPVDLPGGTPGSYGGIHAQRTTEGNDALISKNRLVQLAKTYGAGYLTSMTAQTKPIGVGGSEFSIPGAPIQGGILSGQTGPGSVGGIGSTIISRWADTSLKTQLGIEEAKPGHPYKWADYTNSYYTYGRPYQTNRDYAAVDTITTREEINFGANDKGVDPGPDRKEKINLARRTGWDTNTEAYTEAEARWGTDGKEPEESVMGTDKKARWGEEEDLNKTRLDSYKAIRKITKDRDPYSSGIIDFRSIKANGDGTIDNYGANDTLNPKKDKTLTVRGYPNFLPSADGSPRTDTPDMYYGSDDPGLIPFYFNPVDPAAGSGGSGNIGFRAYIDSLDDAFTPEWGTNKDQGRADNIVQYTGFARTISVSFKVPVTSAGERKEVWSRLNRLARITLPKYGGTAGFYGQFVRVTIGNLYVSIPMYINDLTYSWDAETPWEITKGEQVPFITSVDMSLGWVGNAAPSSTQRAYNYG